MRWVWFEVSKAILIVLVSLMVLVVLEVLAARTMLLAKVLVRVL